MTTQKELPFTITFGIIEHSERSNIGKQILRVSKGYIIPAKQNSVEINLNKCEMSKGEGHNEMAASGTGNIRPTAPKSSARVGSKKVSLRRESESTT